MHAYEWIPHSFPPGHYVLRFVYREAFDGEIPKLQDFAWSILKVNNLTDKLPRTLRLKDPVGSNRHGVFYREDSDVFKAKRPTCTPLTCVYNDWKRDSKVDTSPTVRVFDIDFSDLLGRPVRHATLASEWRLEEAGCNTIRVVKGQSLETEMFDPEREVVLNTAGLEVSSRGPGLTIMERLRNHLQDYPMTRMVGLKEPTTGIYIPKWVPTDERGTLMWFYEPAEG